MGRGGFLTSLAATSFSRTLPHGVNEFKGRRTLKHITSTTNIVCRWRHASTESSTLVRCVSSIKSPRNIAVLNVMCATGQIRILRVVQKQLGAPSAVDGAKCTPRNRLRAEYRQELGLFIHVQHSPSVRPSLAQLHKLRHCHRR